MPYPNENLLELVSHKDPFQGFYFFLLYINDIVPEIGSNSRLFADDTSLFIIVHNPLLAAEGPNTDRDKISQWAAAGLVTFNPINTEALLFSRKLNRPHHPPLFMQNHLISEVQMFKNLGLHFTKD